VPALVPNGESAGTATASIPANTPLGTYVLLACADDLGVVDESDETANCRASAGRIVVGRPDLVARDVSSPPGAAVPGGTFQVTDTVWNKSSFPAGTSRTQYYLSTDGVKSTEDKLLSGSGVSSALAPGTASTGTVTVTIPTSTALGTYFLLACANDAAGVIESDTTNNCRAAAGTIQVGRPNLVSTSVSDPPAAV